MKLHHLLSLALLSLQLPAQVPNAPIPKEEVLQLTGDFSCSKLSRDVHILWLTGPEDHRGGEHDYLRVQELFTPMLRAIPRVSVDVAYSFPTKEQFNKADLLIQYLHLPQLSDQQYKTYKNFVDQGGAVVSIHESCIMRPVADAEKLAACIGCSWKGNRVSKWSKFGHSHPLFLKTGHPTFAGLPKSVQLNDESYWNLLAKKNVEVIGAVAPESAGKKGTFADVLLSKDVRTQAFWTYTSGKGRVFGTTTGHFTYTYHDPMYRLLLLRGIAWALNEDPKPFMPIVFEGITDENGMVGTTNNMMDYKNRKR